MYTISYAGLSDTGRVRSANEDRWFADPDQGLYLVADGIGGSANGGLAAQIVAEVLPRLLRRKLSEVPPRTLARSASEGLPPLTRSASDGSPTLARRASEGELARVPRSRVGIMSIANPPESISDTSTRVSEALLELSEHLRTETQSIPGLKGIGSTVVLARIRDGQAIVAHLGDSRAYLLRAGHLEQLTNDHTVAQLLADRGDIPRDAVPSHPSRCQLTRFVGMSTDAIAETRCIELAAGDRILLCSDGLSGTLSEQQILAILDPQATAEQACRHLIDAANEAGGKDNITAVIVAVREIE